MVAGFPKILASLNHFLDPVNTHSPTVALRITVNKHASKAEQKYKVEKLFEDDGNVASGIAVATYDVEKKKLFLNGKFNLFCCFYPLQKLTSFLFPMFDTFDSQLTTD